ncbi:MAG: hypothetical protein JW395_3734 [Nitrospira sp.]|nr:hypothetical protein [Nitrospira sp.]
MNRPPPHAPPALGLTRRSTSLSPAHVELIKLLAAIAVADYMREMESGTECTDEITQQHEEIIR